MEGVPETNTIFQSLKLKKLNDNQNMTFASESKKVNDKKYERAIIQIREETGKIKNHLIEYIDGKVVYSIVDDNGKKINSNQLHGDNIYETKVREIKNYGIELQKKRKNLK